MPQIKNQGEGHGKSRNGHGKIFCQVCENPVDIFRVPTAQGKQEKWPKKYIDIQGCQFSDFSLISDFLRMKKTCIKLIKSGQNIDKFTIVSKGRLDNPSLITVSKH